MQQAASLCWSNMVKACGNTMLRWSNLVNIIKQDLLSWSNLVNRVAEQSHIPRLAKHRLCPCAMHGIQVCSKLHAALMASAGDHLHNHVQHGSQCDTRTKLPPLHLHCYTSFPQHSDPSSIERASNHVNAPAARTAQTPSISQAQNSKLAQQ
jgi:hypothetical protein